MWSVSGDPSKYHANYYNSLQRRNRKKDDLTPRAVCYCPVARCSGLDDHYATASRCRPRKWFECTGQRCPSFHTQESPPYPLSEKQVIRQKKAHAISREVECNCRSFKCVKTFVVACLSDALVLQVIEPYFKNMDAGMPCEFSGCGRDRALDDNTLTVSPRSTPVVMPRDNKLGGGCIPYCNQDYQGMGQDCIDFAHCSGLPTGPFTGHESQHDFVGELQFKNFELVSPDATHGADSTTLQFVVALTAKPSHLFNLLIPVLSKFLHCPLLPQEQDLRKVGLEKLLECAAGLFATKSFECNFTPCAEDDLGQQECTKPSSSASSTPYFRMGLGQPKPANTTIKAAPEERGGRRVGNLFKHLS
ncbi:unnamed protein product [Mesocestoides corti]|uniref:C3H1-type domain-containing protein n=1 Tax=Mesocestoides corti TaxID=53468 RepID=A0A0R3U9K2_MESCO|nr:unnamed protein product [Mesocestoides corti]